MTPPSPDLTPQDWFDLGYCAPHGIPLSIFRGRYPNPGEPYWLPADTDAARRWHARQNRTCSGCGQDTDVSMKKDNTFGYRVEIGYCHACTAIHRASMRQAGVTEPDPLAGARFLFAQTPETN